GAVADRRLRDDRGVRVRPEALQVPGSGRRGRSGRGVGTHLGSLSPARRSATRGESMNAEPLETLLEKMRAGDVGAAEQGFLAYEPELRLIVRRRLSPRLRPKFDSLDVVQSVWLRVLHDFQEKGC